jgi:carbamoyl-phosphate synthase large subunit
MAGKKLSDLGIEDEYNFEHIAVKESVFPFDMFPEVDPVLGPEMRSTGEVLGMADNAGLAFFKAEEAAKQRLPVEGTVLITVNDMDRARALEVAQRFSELGFKLRATVGTREYLAEHGIDSELILKMHEGSPNITDAIASGEIQLVVNTPSGKLSAWDDSYIRKAAIKYKVPYITTTAAAVSAAKGIAAHRKGDGGVKSLQEYHADIS